jgi:hypothetical protein
MSERTTRMRPGSSGPIDGRLKPQVRAGMKTPGEMEAAVCDGIKRFEQDYMGRGPRDIHSHLLGGLLNSKPTWCNIFRCSTTSAFCIAVLCIAVPGKGGLT